MKWVENIFFTFAGLSYCVFDQSLDFLPIVDKYFI